jgi:hypothetical protein
VSKTYFKLDNDWIELLQNLHHNIADFGPDALSSMAKDYANGVTSAEADEFEYESAVHFFTAIYFIWRKSPTSTRLKLKHIDKLAESMMDTITELSSNPEKRNQLNMMNFLNEKASKIL